VFSVAEHSFSSASFVAKKVKNLPEMPATYGSPIWVRFDRIVKVIGISMVGFGSKQLLDRFQKVNVEVLCSLSIRLFRCREIRENCAQDFLEQKTTAARLAAQV